jgi:hypothetical protein
MQFTSEVNWSVGDFIFAALMFGIVGALLELAVRTTRSKVHRAAIGARLPRPSSPSGSMARWE